MKIAVIGAGVAGIVASYLLQRQHEITLYDRNDYIGGHTHTIVLEKGDDAGTPVDTGFIVFNDKTYPNFLRFLEQLGVEKQNSTMCFSYFDERTGLSYGSQTLDSLFAQRRNACRPSFWMMISGILHFNHHTPRRLLEGRLKGISLGQYLSACRYNPHFIEKYLLPMCASVWSAPDVRMLDFPMETFARFFLNHGLFSIIRHPQWYTVKGGSHEYIRAFLKTFSGHILPDTPVKSVRRVNGKVLIKARNGGEDSFDKVVLACHADESLSLLTDPSPEESRLLGPWSYSPNRTILHTDTAFLPDNQKVWSSWNYVRTSGVETGSPVMLTYHMNRLQNLSSARNQYCVTLNPKKEVKRNLLIKEMMYTHPIYTPDSLSTQSGINDINGQRNTYYCGSYLGYGFHEDAVKSAVAVAQSFGIEL